MRNRIALVIALMGAAVLVVSLSSGSMNPAPPLDQAAPARGQDRQDYNSGAYLYKAFCASCHGDTGRGDGPVADLTIPRPSDLTTLQRLAGGNFPRARVMATLDGTRKVNGHDSMPNWLDVVRRTERGDEHMVRQRLEGLADHIASLQAK